MNNNNDGVSWATRCEIISLQWNHPELTYKKIAELTDVSEATVKRTLTPLFEIGCLERGNNSLLNRNVSWKGSEVSLS